MAKGVARWRRLPPPPPSSLLLPLPPPLGRSLSRPLAPTKRFSNRLRKPKWAPLHEQIYCYGIIGLFFSLSQSYNDRPRVCPLQTSMTAQNRCMTSQNTMSPAPCPTVLLALGPTNFEASRRRRPRRHYRRPLGNTSTSA